MGQDHSQLVEVAAFHHVLHQCSWEDRFKLLSLNRSYRLVMVPLKEHAATFPFNGLSLTRSFLLYACMRACARARVLFAFALVCFLAHFRKHIYEVETWRLFCEWLENDEYVHVLKRQEETWKDAFLRHFPLRQRWLLQSSEAPPKFTERALRQPEQQDGAQQQEQQRSDEEALGEQRERFTIQVCARVRPLPKHLTESDEDTPSEEDSSVASTRKEQQPVRVVVPLHQRIRMIQAHYNCTPSEARKLLWVGHADVPEYDPWRGAVAPNNPPPARTRTRQPLKDVNGASDSKSAAAKSPSPDAAAHDGDASTHSASGSNGTGCCDDEDDGDIVEISGKADADANADSTTSSINSSNNSGGSDKGDSATGEQERKDQDQDQDQPCALPSTVRTGVLAVRPATRDLVLCAGGGLKRFEFDSVFSDSMDQDAVYEQTAREQVGQFLNGVNACVVCYGQTGSGKTFTMFGPNDLASSTVTELSDHAGIAPRAITDVVNTVLRRRRNGLQVSLKLSVVEIFGQAVTDLLHDRGVVGAWHGVAARAVLNNEAAEEIEDPMLLDDLLLRAERAKRRAATAMNERSSRAHTVLLLSLDQRNNKTGTRLQSTLCLADLGGSEQLKKSKVSLTLEAGGGC